MIVCSCNKITLKEIEEVIIGFLDVDAWQLITPGMVYHAMHKRGKCCGCFPRVVDTIVRITKDYHNARASRDADVICLIDRIWQSHAEREAKRKELAAAKQCKAA